MIQFNIMLNTIEDVRNLVNIVTRFDYEVDLSSKRYVVDAKSIMGIFSLDLMSPISLTIHSEKADDLVEALTSFKLK